MKTVRIVALIALGFTLGLGSGACWLDGEYFRCGRENKDLCRHDTR